MSEFSILDPGYGPGPTDYNPVSGIHYNILESEPGINLIHCEYFNFRTCDRNDLYTDVPQTLKCILLLLLL